MRWIVRIARLLLGIIFVVFGLNGFFNFIPVPELHPFMQMMVDSGFIYVVKALEVMGGLMLLINIRVPLALLIIGPIVINIVLYHAFFDPRNWLVSVVNLVLYVIILIAHWPTFRSVLQNSTPQQ
ncbi:DoxX family membrane protein [Tunicatimonas pelagia]|uniref:DoxX family membrane protein n=1 Tax=Tunicatimonas pelagia TaxID=931531 RepID=UPI0026667F34|nr:DoxX family membrane protein [Tunicatimonas pelagia]WKN45901.1 DoxX family membrane protein [Tunicatimonas pelagia]